MSWTPLQGMTSWRSQLSRSTCPISLKTMDTAVFFEALFATIRLLRPNTRCFTALCWRALQLVQTEVETPSWCWQDQTYSTSSLSSLSASNSMSIPDGGSQSKEAKDTRNPYQTMTSKGLPTTPNSQWKWPRKSQEPCSKYNHDTITNQLTNRSRFPKYSPRPPDARNDAQWHESS